jgi:hypothetical protein
MAFQGALRHGVGVAPDGSTEETIPTVRGEKEDIFLFARAYCLPVENISI